MDKRTVIAVLLSLVILIGWQMLFTPVPPMDPEHMQSISDNSVAAPAENNSENLSSQTAALDAALLGETPVVQLEEPAKVTTDKIEISFDKQNGDIRSASVLGWKDVDGDYVTFNKGEGFNYMRLITPVLSGYVMDVQDTQSGKRVTFTATSGDVTIVKEYNIPNDSYLVRANVHVSNTGSVNLNIPVQVKIGPKLGEGFEESVYVFEGAIISNDDTTERVEADKSKTEELAKPLWVGYTSKYFLFAAAGNDFATGSISPENGGEVASASKSFVVNSGEKASNGFDIYIGPKEYNNLRALGLGLQTSIDFGWFYFLAIPMLQLMIFFYGFFHNYGMAIIFLTIVIKVITLPLTTKGMKSMKAMAKLQPEMAALKEKFANEPQKMQAATMELYKKHGVNPFSGCLPLLIQIPIFFALYKALLLAIELKGAPFFGWLVDLSEKDPYYITPIIMGVTMFIQQKMTPSTADPVQQKIFLAMPIIFTFLFLNFPSGLVIYWLTNNVLSIIQQYYINKKSA